MAFEYAEARTSVPAYGEKVQNAIMGEFRT